jgi:hypothetical protein
MRTSSATGASSRRKSTRAASSRHWQARPRPAAALPLRCQRREPSADQRRQPGRHRRNEEDQREQQHAHEEERHDRGRCRASSRRRGDAPSSSISKAVRRQQQSHLHPDQELDHAALDRVARLERRIAFGPPMKLICSVPLPSADPLLEVDYLDPVLGERADEPERRFLRKRARRRESCGDERASRDQESMDGVHGDGLRRGGVGSGLQTLPCPWHRGRGICLEPLAVPLLAAAPRCRVSAACTLRTRRRAPYGREPAIRSGPSLRRRESVRRSGALHGRSRAPRRA